MCVGVWECWRSTKCKDTATKKREKDITDNMDEIIDLWTKMLEADQAHDDKIVSNVRDMQRGADEAVRILREQLAKLHAIALSAVAGAGSPLALVRAGLSRAR